MKRLAAFVLAGGAGFLADAVALTLLLEFSPLGPLAARLLSIGAALTLTWSINRSLTFGPSSRHVTVEGVRYGSVGIATSILNYLVYAALLAIAPALPPLAALVAASAVAMIFSYLGYSRLVFDR